MAENASAIALERFEKHYFFELERRDRIHASLRLIATVKLAILGAAWLLVSDGAGGGDTLSMSLIRLSAIAAAASAVCAILGLVQVAPIATEDHYRVVLQPDVVATTTRILGTDASEDPAVDGRSNEAFRSEALAIYWWEAYAKAAAVNLQINERFVARRREATHLMIAAAVLICLSGTLRYIAGQA